MTEHVTSGARGFIQPLRVTPKPPEGTPDKEGRGGLASAGGGAAPDQPGGARRWRPRPPGPPGAPRLPPGGANSTPGRGPGAGRRQRRGPGREADRRAAASQRRSSRCSQCRRGCSCRGTAEHPRAAGSGRRRQVARGSAWCGPSSSSPAPGGRGPAAGPPPVLPPRPVPFPGSPERAGGDAGNVSGERSPPAPARSQVGEFLLCFASLCFASLCSASLCFASLRFSSLAEPRSLGAGADPAAGPIPAADAPRSTAGCPQPRGSGSDVPPAGSSQGEA